MGITSSKSEWCAPGRGAYVRLRTDRGSQAAQFVIQMSGAIHSSSSRHKQAASAHELTARQHRAAAAR